MAVTITAPQSGYFDRTGAITVSWTNSITSPPQTAYEIMYKLKTASSWSTLGRVTSTATSANLKPIYDAVSQDAVEFYYKVVVYHDLATLSSGNKEGGIEHSAVYSIMFHGSQIATLKVQETASLTQIYPLFNGSTTPTAKLNVRTTSSATGTAPLVASGHPLAGRGKVITASGYTAFIGGSSPTFAASGQNRYGYFYGYRYQYSFSYYNYNYANYRTDSYNVLQYYYTVYNQDVTSTHETGEIYRWDAYNRSYSYNSNLPGIGTQYITYGGILREYYAWHGYGTIDTMYHMAPSVRYVYYVRSYTPVYGYYLHGYYPIQYSVGRYYVSYYNYYTSYNNSGTRYGYSITAYRYIGRLYYWVYSNYFRYYYYYYYTRLVGGYKPLIGAYRYYAYNRLNGPFLRSYVAGRYVSSTPTYYRTFDSTYNRLYSYAYRTVARDSVNILYYTRYTYYYASYRSYLVRNNPNYALGVYNTGNGWVVTGASHFYYRVYRRYTPLLYYYTRYSYTYINSYTNTNRYWYTNNNSYNYQYYTR